MSKRTHPLDEKFLARFARNSWEKKPLVLKNIQTDLLELDDREVFHLVVKAADRSRRDKKLLGFKFYANGIRSSDVEALFVLPRKNDKSFQGYNERMERVYQDYCLVCDELLQVNKDKQALLTEFTQRLYRHVGYPNRFAEMGLYLGNYRKTPFGVHRDTCGVFSFPINGKKTFRAWPSSYVAKHPSLEQSFSYSKHKPASQVLTAGTGDMIYWPSSSWHIAESDGSFSATWSLGVWVDRPVKETVSDTLMLLLATKLKSDLDSPYIFETRETSNGEIKANPDIFSDAIEVLKSLSLEELETSFRTTWMNRLAQGGLKTQAKSDEPFRLEKTLKLRDRLIFWTAAAHGSEFHFAYGDSGAQTSTSKKLLNLIQQLNAGKICKSSGFSKKDLSSIRLLGQAGAFA